MHRILWTASMHAILRRMLSLLSSVLFSIPLPWKFSIPRSLEIALQSGLNLVVNLTCQTWEAGLFCAVDAVVVSQIRDLLHSTRVYLSDKLLGLENKRQKTSFIWWLNTLKSSAVIQRRTWTMFYQQSLSHVWEMFKRNCGQRKPCCSSSRKVPPWSIYWPHTLSLHFRLLLQTKRSNWCIKSHEDPMKKIIDISVAWNLLKKKL